MLAGFVFPSFLIQACLVARISLINKRFTILCKRLVACKILFPLLKVMTVIMQEVTPTSYEIFQKSGWWKGYRCSIANEGDFTAGYFCIQVMSVYEVHLAPFNK